MQEESPEGGRFKKEIFIDNQSYLLLIRDEGGLPEMQVIYWIFYIKVETNSWASQLEMGYNGNCASQWVMGFY